MKKNIRLSWRAHKNKFLQSEMGIFIILYSWNETYGGIHYYGKEWRCRGKNAGRNIMKHENCIKNGINRLKCIFFSYELLNKFWIFSYFVQFAWMPQPGSVAAQRRGRRPGPTVQGCFNYHAKSLWLCKGWTRFDSKLEMHYTYVYTMSKLKSSFTIYHLRWNSLLFVKLKKEKNKPSWDILVVYVRQNSFINSRIVNIVSK